MYKIQKQQTEAKLIELGLQPVRYLTTTKREDLKPSKIKSNNPAGWLTIGNRPTIESPEDWFHEWSDANDIGLRLNNTHLTHTNNGYVILDGDTKTKQDEQQLVEALAKLNPGCVQTKGSNFHAIIKMSEKDITRMVANGRILIGDSFIEVFTAGKFLRIGQTSGYTTMNLDNITTHTIQQLQELGTEKFLHTTKKKRTKQLQSTPTVDRDYVETQELINMCIAAEDTELLQRTLSTTKAAWNMEAYAQSFNPTNKSYWLDLYNQQVKPQPRYVPTNSFDLPEGSYIIKAKTGAGKTTAVMNYYKDKPLLFVSPLNGLANQISEEYPIPAINSTTNKNQVRATTLGILSTKGSCVISLTNLIENTQEYQQYLADYNVVIDEAHLIMFEHPTAPEIINQLKCKTKILLTATPRGLELLYPHYQQRTIYTQTIYNKTLHWVDQAKTTSHKLSALVKIKQDNPQSTVVVMWNSIDKLNQAKKELETQGYVASLYTSETKDTDIVDNQFNKVSDFVLATSSIATGISLKGDIVLVYIYGATTRDTIVEFQQFFARNRNEQSIGYVIKPTWNTQSNMVKTNMKKHLQNFIHRDAGLMKTTPELIVDKLQADLFYTSKEGIDLYLDDSFTIADEVVKFTKSVQLTTKPTQPLTPEQRYNYWLRGHKLKGTVAGVREVNYLIEFTNNHRDLYNQLTIHEDLMINKYKILTGIGTSKLKDMVIANKIQTTEVPLVDTTQLQGKFNKKEFVAWGKKIGLSKEIMKSRTTISQWLETQDRELVKTDGYYYYR